MPDGSTHTQLTPRPPRVVENLQQLCDLVARLRSHVSFIDDIDLEETRKLKNLEERKQKVRNRTARKREWHKARIRALTPKGASYAQENRRKIATNRNRTTATLPTGNSLEWGTSLKVELPENLDLFFDEMKERGKEEKYVRIKREPNKLALRDEDNKAEVETFETVTRRHGPRLRFKFPGLLNRVVCWLGAEGEIEEIDVYKPRP
jgi:phage host-nuclease inhibitor protein Gam